MNAPSTTLFCARYLLPIGAPPIEDGGLLVRDGHILAVDRRKNLRSAVPGVELIDFGDAVLLPPMANAHTHLELTDFPVWAETIGTTERPENFVDWLLSLVRVRRNVDGQAIAASLSNGLRQSLQAGTGLVGDICTTFEATQAYQRSPLSGRVFAEVLGYDDLSIDQRLAQIDAETVQSPGPWLEWGVSPHAPYTLSARALDRVCAFAASRSLPCAVHLAESREETQFLQQGSGAIAERLCAAAGWRPDARVTSGDSPVAALCRPGRLKAGDLVIHGVQVDADDMTRLRKVGCSVVLCPRSNAALQVGKAPLRDYLQAGVNLCLGTDSLASAPNLSLWEELAFARSWFAGELEPARWLELATCGGARALGFEDRTGHFAPGCDASFQVVRLADSVAVAELEESLCAAGSVIRVSSLYLAGQNVLPDGRVSSNGTS
ncbi:MAG: amidohydrolase family protein [Desulfuromonadales bacterium]